MFWMELSPRIIIIIPLLTLGNPLFLANLRALLDCSDPAYSLRLARTSSSGRRTSMLYDKDKFADECDTKRIASRSAAVAVALRVSYPRDLAIVARCIAKSM